MAATIYHPKGSMCATCERKHGDCSNLNFEYMTIMGKYKKQDDPTEYVTVICEKFEYEE